MSKLKKILGVILYGILALEVIFLILTVILYPEEKRYFVSYYDSFHDEQTKSIVYGFGFCEVEMPLGIRTFSDIENIAKSIQEDLRDKYDVPLKVAILNYRELKE